MRTHVSKLLISATALAVGLAMAAATSAEAQSSKGKKRVAAKPEVAAKAKPRRSDASRWEGGFRVTRSGAIYNGPDYIGQDLDPHIRFELMREMSARYGGID